MDATFVKSSVMDAKIDLTVVIDVSTFKIGGWKKLQSSDPQLLVLFMDDNEPWLLVTNSKQGCSFLVTQYLERISGSSDQHMNKLM